MSKNLLQCIVAGLEKLYDKPQAPVTVTPGPYNGPTAVQIADAQIDRNRARLQGFIRKGTGTGVVNLGLPIGTRGNLKSITASVGTVRFTLDGSPPAVGAGPDRGENALNASVAGVDNVDLSLLRLAGTAASTVYTVYYEVYS